MFMVFVAGKQTPRVSHETEQVARHEAERLSILPENIGISVLLLKVIASCSCKIQSEWKEE